MGLVRPSALLLGSVLAGPALWHGLVTGELDVTSALVRFVLGVGVGAVMLAGLRTLTAGYGRNAAAATSGQRPALPEDDAPDRS